MISFDPPEHIEQILRSLTENGHAAFLVGGCVRDSIIGRPVHDWDVAGSAAPDDIKRIFQQTILTGEKFGTVTVVLHDYAVEVTTFRTEGDYRDGRRPESVEFVASIDEDLSRRDFTINAMAVTLSGELIDPFGGLEDIKKRVIRCVGEPDVRFAEDALRMFRALRFSAELGFAIEPETLSSIYANADKAMLISVERIHVELEKTLLSQRPCIVGEMIKAGLLKKYAPASGECLDGLENLAAIPAETALRWCAFCAILIDKGFMETADGFLRDMRIDAKTIRNCSSALSIKEFPDDHVGIKRLLAKYGTDVVRCAAAARVALRDSSALMNTHEVIAGGECFSLSALAVSGRDLISSGCPAGREIGETLAVLLDHVIENPKDNTRGALMKIIEESTKM